MFWSNFAQNSQTIINSKFDRWHNFLQEGFEVWKVPTGNRKRLHRGQYLKIESLKHWSTQGVERDKGPPGKLSKKFVIKMLQNTKWCTLLHFEIFDNITDPITQIFHKNLNH